jgi:thiamine kinase-like enzyme
MENSGITPKLNDFIESELFQYIVMDYIHGINGQIFLDNGDIDEARKIYKLMASCLVKDIHSIKNIKNNYFLSKINYGNIDFESLDYFTIDLTSIVKYYLNIDIGPKETLIHGDLGPHNLILSNDLNVFLDWEWSGWGSPIQGIALVIWFVHLHYPQFCKELSGIFLDTYYSHNKLEISEEIIKAALIQKIVYILNFAKDQNNDVKEEWVKRLKWTLEIEFLSET